MLSIQLPADLEARLSALAENTGRTKADYAREAILHYLDDLDDLALAEQRLLDVRAGCSKTISLQDVMKEYEMKN